MEESGTSGSEVRRRRLRHGGGGRPWRGARGRDGGEEGASRGEARPARRKLAQGNGGTEGKRARGRTAGRGRRLIGGGRKVRGARARGEDACGAGEGERKK